MRGKSTTITKVATALGGAVACLALAAPAVGHVTVSPAEAPADGYAKLDFSVGHGCDGSPTTAVRVQIPDSVPTATPQVHPGWEVSTEEGPKVPAELHGEEVTRGVSEIVWRAADAGPLPDDRLDVFGVSVKLPAGESGEPVYFPTVQECEQGENRWIQLPQPGEDAHELESPAPVLTLAAAAGDGHGDGAGTDGSGTEDGATAQASESEDDAPSTGLVIAALAIGALGLLVATWALVSARRRP